MTMHSASLSGVPAALATALQNMLGKKDVRFCKIAAEGNQAFERGDNEVAARLFEDAVAEANALFAAARTDTSFLIAPMAYTIACNNIAAVKARTGEWKAAYELRLRAVTRLIDVAESLTEPLALRLSCVRQLRNAVAFLSNALSPPGNSGHRTELKSILERYRDISGQLTKIATAELLIQEEPTSSTSLRRSGSRNH